MQNNAQNEELTRSPTTVLTVYTNSSVLSSLKIRGRSPRTLRLDKTRAMSVLNSFKNDPSLVAFAFSFKC